MTTKKTAPRISSRKLRLGTRSSSSDDPCAGIDVTHPKKGGSVCITAPKDQDCVVTIEVRCGRRRCMLQRCHWDGDQWVCDSDAGLEEVDG
jgi:hypothetical protein